QGSDTKQGDVIIQKDTRISAAEIGILAAVGSVEVVVKKLPEVCLISTGNELVAVHEVPAAHQIRESNMHTLHALLALQKIEPKHHHFDDDKETIIASLDSLLNNNNVLIISGGVSKGKFDYMPEAMDQLGVQECFPPANEKVGVTVWFGIYRMTSTIVLSLPGSPVSTLVGCHIYFKPRLYGTLGVKQA